MRDFKEHINENWNSFRDKEIVVACSGGLDSTVLLHLLSTNEFKVLAIHVNYQLRGEDSNLDEVFIRNFCKELNIPFESRSVDLGERLKLGGNLQQLAREIRYDWFKEITTENENRFVFLAHHLNDQVETFFMNLARKSGIMGLACMPYERNQIVRPLLDFTKEELKEYAIENKLTWREDSSNASNKYRRNLLRNEILPHLSKEIPGLNESVITLVKSFQENQLLLENSIQPLIDEILINHSIEQSKIETLAEFELIELFRKFGQSVQLVNEFDNLLSSQKGKRIELTSHPKNPFAAIVKEADSFSFISKNEYSISKDLKIEIVDALPTVFSKDEIYLDQNKIKGELKLRRWEVGDRIQSIGMDGSQLISDVISDLKMNAIDKRNVHVLCDNETIHWCIGLKVGRKAVANKNSICILKVSIN
jgi:tRNA(Ile)-lysidine synthase